MKHIITTDSHSRNILPLCLAFQAAALFLFTMPLYGNVEDTLLVAFTANNNGQLLDCGCETRAPGGLPRRLTAVNQMRERYGEILLLDGGDLLGTTGRKAHDGLVLEAYRKMDYDGLAIGDQEFWHGWTFFQQKLLGSDLPLLIGNIGHNEKKTSRHEISLEPVLRFKKGGFEINLFAFLHSNSFLFFEDKRKPDIELNDVNSSLRKKLENHADFGALNFVLFHGDRWLLEELTQAFPEILIWFHSHEPTDRGDSWQEQRPPVIVSAGVDGESIELVLITQSTGVAPKITTRRLVLEESIQPDMELQEFLQESLDTLN